MHRQCRAAQASYCCASTVNVAFPTSAANSWPASTTNIPLQRALFQITHQQKFASIEHLERSGKHIIPAKISTLIMPQSEDREVILQFDSAGRLYLRELRPKRKLCSKCSRIPLAFFVEPGIDNGINFLPLSANMLSNEDEEFTTIYNTLFAPDFSNPAVFEHRTFNGLQRSVKSGCHLCTLIDRSLESGGKSALTAATDVDDGKIILTHQVKRFPIGTKWDAIIPIHLRKGSNCGPLVRVGLYLRFMVTGAPGRFHQKLGRQAANATTRLGRRDWRRPRLWSKFQDDQRHAAGLPKRASRLQSKRRKLKLLSDSIAEQCCQ